MQQGRNAGRPMVVWHVAGRTREGLADVSAPTLQTVCALLDAGRHPDRRHGPQQVSRAAVPLATTGTGLRALGSPACLPAGWPGGAVHHHVAPRHATHARLCAACGRATDRTEGPAARQRGRSNNTTYYISNLTARLASCFGTSLHTCSTTPPPPRPAKQGQHTDCMALSVLSRAQQQKGLCAGTTQPQKTRNHLCPSARQSGEAAKRQE